MTLANLSYSVMQMLHMIEQYYFTADSDLHDSSPTIFFVFMFCPPLLNKVSNVNMELCPRRHLHDRDAQHTAGSADVGMP